MALEVLELHHHAVRMPLGKVEAMGAFYGDVLGLDTDQGRWQIPGIAGYFLDMGNDCQIHLLGSDGPSPYSQGPGRDPVENHVALAVRDIAASEQELRRLGVDYWKLDNVAAPELMQLFLRDPVGNLIELHQIGSLPLQAQRPRLRRRQGRHRRHADRGQGLIDMFIDLEALPGPARYKLLTAAIVPRPIAWIVSRDARGTTNVAPFSFFNLMSGDPPLICVGIGVRDGAPKDTARNIAERGEFTVNLVSSALASRMNVTAVDFPHGVDEAQEAGLLLAPGERVSVPRVAQSPVSFECRLHQLLRIDGRSLVIAEVAAMHARDDVVSDPERLYLDGSRMDLLARLHNPGWYCRPQADFQMPQLTREQWDEIKRDGSRRGIPGT
ncbi:flavin reductase [Achromobacter xylosoxidans]